MSATGTSVAVLGATRLLGQFLIQALWESGDFEITALAELDIEPGQRFGEAVTWHHPRPLPAPIAELPLLDDLDQISGDLVLSVLPDGRAGEIERRLAERGHRVVTHAEDLRLAADVPLILSELNGAEARRAVEAGTRLLATPNCTTVLLGLPLMAVHEAFVVESVTVTALQAVSGADQPGLPWFAIHDTLMPGLEGEVRALERETARLFDAAFPISVQALRVPVTRGHALAVSLALKRPAKPEEAAKVLSASRAPMELAERPPADLRQSFDCGAGDTLVISGLAPCPVADLRFTISGDNLHRGVVTTLLDLAERLAGFQPSQ